MAEEPQTRTTRAQTAGDEEDRALLERINTGDRDALRALYVKYYHPLLRFIYRITGQFELAQEGINDVMLVVWSTGRAFERRSAVSTWILGIAYRKALKLAEKSRRWTDRLMPVEDFEAWIERSGATEEHSHRADLGDLLRQGLGQLPAEQRAVVELTYFHGCSYREIAAITDCPVNTVKTRMFHARRKLRKLLPDLGKDELKR